MPSPFTPLSQLRAECERALGELRAAQAELDREGREAARQDPHASVANTAEQGARATKARVDAAFRALEADVSACERGLAASGPVSGANDRLARVRASLRAQKTPLGEAAVAPLAEVEATAKLAAQALQRALDAGAQRRRHELDTLLARVTGLRDELATSERALRDELRDHVADVERTLARAETTLDAALRGVEAQRETGRRATVGDAEGRKAQLRDQLARLEAGLSTLRTTLEPAIEGGRRQIDAADAAIKRTAQLAIDGLDVVRVQGVTRVQSYVDQFASAVQAGLSALDAVVETIHALRSGVLPPIEALSALMTQLKDMFDTGISLLQGALDAASTALDAIPAQALPKALVQATLTAIKGAVDAAAPQITNAAQQAGNQLASLAGQLSTQIESAKTSAFSQIDGALSQVVQQIDAVLPPLQSQLASAQQQIRTLVDGLVQQARTTQASVVAQVEASISQVESSVERAVQGADGQLTTASDALSSGLTEVRAGIRSARAALDARVASDVAGLAARADQALAQFRAAADSARAALTQLEQQAASRAAALAQPGVRTLAEARAQRDATLTGARSERERALGDANARADAALVALPEPEAVDALLAPLRAQVSAELAQIRGRT
jgi:hypothetical protein